MSGDKQQHKHYKVLQEQARETQDGQLQSTCSPGAFSSLIQRGFWLVAGLGVFSTLLFLFKTCVWPLPI